MGINLVHREPNMGLAFLFGLIVAILVWLLVHRDTQTIESTEQAPLQQIIQDVPITISKEADFAQANSKVPVIETTVESQEKEQLRPSYEEPIIRVYLSETKLVEKVLLEDYVRGVVAAEMPLDFEQAALEAQAIAARTYIIRRLWLDNQGGGKSATTDPAARNADVTNTQENQVYKSLADMKQLRQNNPLGWKKLNAAVNQTAGEIITFEDEPIEALYFSTSNGYTENSEDVFPTKLPYLRSVASPWDKRRSPRAKETVEMSLADFYEKLGVNAEKEGGVKSNRLIPRVLAWTKGSRVKEVSVGKHKFTGIELRHLLGLRSAAIEWSIRKNRITLTTYGSGHGVGMSQWGAEGMASAGKTTEQIVQHYYYGTQIEQAAKLVNGSETGR